MDQKLRSVVDQELLEHLTNQIGSKAKSSGHIKQRLWIIGTFISLLVVVMVVVTTNQATNTSKKPSLENASTLGLDSCKCEVINCSIFTINHVEKLEI